MWGVVAGLGVAMALQPLPVLAVVLLLSAENGLRKAWAFVLGELLVMFGIAAATIALHGQGSHHETSRAASWVTLAAGLVLLGVGARWALRLRRGAELERPQWMARLDRMEPWPAFLLGMFLPTYLIAVAVGAHIVGTYPSTAVAVAGVLVFVLVGMSTAYTPVVLAQFLSDRSGPARARLRDWLERYWSSVAVILLLVVGSFLLGKGLLALS